MIAYHWSYRSAKHPTAKSATKTRYVFIWHDLWLLTIDHIAVEAKSSQPRKGMLLYGMIYDYLPLIVYSSGGTGKNVVNSRQSMKNPPKTSGRSQWRRKGKFWSTVNSSMKQGNQGGKVNLLLVSTVYYYSSYKATTSMCFNTFCSSPYWNV